MKEKRTTKGAHVIASAAKQTSGKALACFAAALLAMTLLAGCANDDAGPADDDAAKAVSFTASSLRGNEATQTRTSTAADGATTWLESDKVGIFMTTDPGLPADILTGGDNVEYHPAAAGASAELIPTGTAIYWPDKVGEYTFIAYSPRLEVGAGGIDPTDYTYPLDVSDQSDPAKLDLLRAIKLNTTYGDNVSFEFAHRMAKLRVNLTAGGTLTAADFGGCTAEAYGLPTTAKFSIGDNRFSDKGNIAPIALPAVTPGEGYAATFEAIVIHEEYEEFTGRYLKLTLPGAGDYYWTIPDNIMITGNTISIFNLTLSAEGVTFTGSSIEPWADNGTPTEGGKIRPESNPVAQPEANSYMVEPGGAPILIPVSQANRVATDALGATTDGLGGVTADNFTVELVWGDQPVGTGGVIKAMRPYNLDGEYIYVEPGTTAGNAVIAIRDKATGTIKWSWHIWVTPEVGSATDATTGITWMDRNLGARATTYDAAGRNGLYYQWGRKDAFPAGDGTLSGNQTYYTAAGGTTGLTDGLPTAEYTELPDMVQNPFTFASNNETYYGSLNVAGEGNDSWGGVSGTKTLYDPCPPGWKVPATGNWGSDADWGAWENSGRVFKPVNHFYPAAGYRYYNTSATLYSSGNLGYYWVSGAYSTKLGWRLTFNSSDVYPQSLSDRANGQSVRCIKEQ